MRLAIVVAAVVVTFGGLCTAATTTTARDTNPARTLAGKPLPASSSPQPISSHWSRIDKINLLTAIATTGYLLATLVLVFLMRRANQISSKAARQNAEVAQHALEETRRSNELTREALAVAQANVRVAQQTFDSQLLDRYLPIQGAIGSTLGAIRASRIFPDEVRASVIPADFTEAVRLAASVDGALHGTLQVTSAVLEGAERHRKILHENAAKYPPDDPFITGVRELFKLDLESAELVLMATAAELEGTIKRLRASTGRQDITLANLKLPVNGNAA